MHSHRHKKIASHGISILMLIVCYSRLEPRVVGGEDVALEEYAFSVQFLNAGSLCGGVIMNSWMVLTAAHCFDRNKDVEKMIVQVAARYLNDVTGKLHKINTFVVHENYSKRIPFECDVALILLNTYIKLNNLANRAVIVNHSKWMTPMEKNFEVVGWGWMAYNGTLSEHLMRTHLRFVSLPVCSKLNNVTLSKDMFCLYGEGIRDTCRGDSGGGVLWKGLLVGLTSHGNGCARKLKPSMYTNVYYFKDWIKNQTYKLMDENCIYGPIPLGYIIEKSKTLNRDSRNFVNFRDWIKVVVK